MPICYGPAWFHLLNFQPPTARCVPFLFNKRQGQKGLQAQGEDVISHGWFGPRRQLFLTSLARGVTGVLGNRIGIMGMGYGDIAKMLSLWCSILSSRTGKDALGLYSKTQLVKLEPAKCMCKIPACLVLFYAKTTSETVGHYRCAFSSDIRVRFPSAWAGKGWKQLLLNSKLTARMSTSLAFNFQGNHRSWRALAKE